MSYPVFNRGDYIVLERPVGNLREGEVFRVVDYYRGLVDNMCVDVIDSAGHTLEYIHAHRFKLKEE